MRVLAGLTRPDSGTIRIDGLPVVLSSAARAADVGVGMVHQHFTLVPVFTVLENVALGAEPPLLSALGSVRDRLVELSRELGLPVDPDARVEDLSVGERQRVEILRVLLRGARILVLDEPTAVLTPGEARELYRTLRKLADGGRTVIFITHRLREVLEASDRITVLRAGRRVAGLAAADATEAELARLMVGREVLGAEGGARPGGEPGSVGLSVSGVDVDSDRGLPALRGATLAVRSCEIVGLAGVMGNGQTELVEAILGVRALRGGSVRLGDRDLGGLSVRDRLRAGLAVVPEDRLDRGLVSGLSVAENLALGLLDDPELWRGPLLVAGALREKAFAAIETLDVRPPEPSAVVRTFSGGNQQKVLLARALAARPRVLVVAEPCRGLDVGAVERVHAAIREVRDGGAAVLLVSSDLSEIIALSDRVVVLRRGAVVGEVDPRETSEEEIGLLIAGGHS